MFCISRMEFSWLPFRVQRAELEDVPVAMIRVLYRIWVVDLEAASTVTVLVAGSRPMALPSTKV